MNNLPETCDGQSPWPTGKQKKTFLCDFCGQWTVPDWRMVTAPYGVRYPPRIAIRICLDCEAARLRGEPAPKHIDCFRCGKRREVRWKPGWGYLCTRQCAKWAKGELCLACQGSGRALRPAGERVGLRRSEAFEKCSYCQGRGWNESA